MASQDRLEPGDIEEGLRAAAAIGDDTLQKRARGHVVPESFTHGTAAQRVQWFKRGFDSGDVEGLRHLQRAESRARSRLRTASSAGAASSGSPPPRWRRRPSAAASGPAWMPYQGNSAPGRQRHGQDAGDEGEEMFSLMLATVARLRRRARTRSLSA